MLKPRHARRIFGKKTYGQTGLNVNEIINLLFYEDTPFLYFRFLRTQNSSYQKYCESCDIFCGQQHHKQAPQQNDATKDAAHIASIHNEEDDNNASNIVIVIDPTIRQILTSAGCVKLELLHRKWIPPTLKHPK